MNKCITKFVGFSKYISFLVDYGVLYGIHKVKSKELQFKHNYQIPGETDFFPEPLLPDIQLKVKETKRQCKIGTYSFNSQIKSEHHVNNIVQSEFNEYENAGANVIVINGWRADGIEGAANLFLKPFCERKFNVYFYSLPYHLHRVPEGSYNGEYFISANIGRTLLAVKQAVTDVRNLIRWIKKNRTGKIILAGISMGGYITNLVSTQEEIDLLVSVFYANNLPYIIWNALPGKYVKEDFVKNNFSYDKLQEAWKVINPCYLEPIVSKKNILLISGRHDMFVPFEDSTNLWKIWGKPERKVYPFGHAGFVINESEIVKDSMRFIDERIK